MRVVHLCRVGWPSIGGVERMVDGLSRYQVGQGHDVTVVTGRRMAGRRVDHAMREGVRYHRVHALGRGAYSVPWGLDRLLEGADVVHAHGLDGFTDLGVRLSRAPVGVSTHGGPLHTGKRRWLKALALRTRVRATASRADAVWYTSRADRRALKMLNCPGSVVGNGLDLAPWLALPRQPEPGLWVVPGRITPHKRVDAVLAVAARMPVTPTVAIVGVPQDAVYVGQLRQEAAESKVPVEWVTRATDAVLRTWVSRAEHVFFPSRYEGFGLGVVEAMAAGASVWVSDIPAHRERVRSGVEGQVVDFDDQAAVARALGDPSQPDTGPAARQAAAHYDWSVVGPQWERAYAHLLAKRTP